MAGYGTICLMTYTNKYLCLTEEQQQGEDIPDDLVDEENVALKNVTKKERHGFNHNEMQDVCGPVPTLESLPEFYQDKIQQRDEWYRSILEGRHEEVEFLKHLLEIGDKTAVRIQKSRAKFGPRSHNRTERGIRGHSRTNKLDLLIATTNIPWSDEEGAQLKSRCTSSSYLAYKLRVTAMKRHKDSRKTRHVDQRKSQAIEGEAQASQNGNPNFNTTPTNSSGVPVLLGSVNPQYGLQQVRITVKFRFCRGTFQQP
ncbi:hypothetical protein FPSE_02564 [Fusarium pseudograminearum CS3096]|uniref:Uncharacterized protein n=1 Tax=Fusarium pseudograminearum (strain CS3096) TaxID=1028729 RepID=K3VQL3_FUSPC|nr:hypothetical protein FPSE_02564 [Fusarium pseudograminearum CS3096]EKJ77289.1 hypothetical protein FPSE_02564 [Fusarium pseudograminearum CS3096]